MTSFLVWYLSYVASRNPPQYSFHHGAKFLISSLAVTVLVHVPVSGISVYSDVVLPLQKLSDMIYLVILDLGDIFDVLAPLTTII